MLQTLGRKLFLAPRKPEDDLLTRYYAADQELVHVAQQIKKLEANKHQERVSELIAQLKECQQKVMQLIIEIMDEFIPHRRHARDFRTKFPDEVVQEGLEGQLWYASECLAAGSSILYREIEAESIRPLAIQVTREGEKTRRLLRDAARAASDNTRHNCRLLDQLAHFDSVLAEFELGYVSAMVPVKTMTEMEQLQEVAVLFSESTDWALERRLIDAEELEACEPTLMLVLPRLAVLLGLSVFADGPLSSCRSQHQLCSMFRAFHTHLDRVRTFVQKLSAEEFNAVARDLCLMDFDAGSGRQRRSRSDGLFKVIAGVADQMQSNHAWELRYLMRCVHSLHTLPQVEQAIDAIDWQGVPEWMPDEASDTCTQPDCALAFTVYRRRHHCRSCGGLFCHACTRRRIALRGFQQPQRVCTACYDAAAAASAVAVAAGGGGGGGGSSGSSSATAAAAAAAAAGGGASSSSSSAAAAAAAADCN